MRERSMTIGERAAQAIRERAIATGKSAASIIETMGANRKTLGDWEKRGRNPCGYWLAQLDLAGFDIHWILTGQRERKYPVTDVDFDICEYEEEL